MDEIKFDKRNYRKHNDKNKSLIHKSLKECGAGRSIIVDNEGEIIAGNGVYEQAKKLGLKTKIVETDGSELVVVKRTDLSTDDDKRRRLAVMDNSASDTSEFNLELLQADFEVGDLSDMGIDIKIGDEDKYTLKIEAPVYEPTREKKPTLAECVDMTKYNELVEHINKSELPEEEKQLLTLAASRHICFNYENICEYYCHSDKATKKLMEESALVIIDINDAIANGFVKLTEDFLEKI